MAEEFLTLMADFDNDTQQRMSVFMKSFNPFVGKITRLHLCAFWPKREIATVELTGYR